MAEDSLSREEVESLMRGVPGGPAAAREAPRDAVRPFDIALQERMVRARMPALELVNDRFARLLHTALSDFLRRNTVVAAGPVCVLKYSEFVRDLVAPTNLNLVHIKPLRGVALIVLEPALVFHAVDQLFGGGHGRLPSRVEGREFTHTELRIIRRLLDLVFDCYRRAWEPVRAIHCDYVRSETNPEFASIAAPGEMVVTTTFSVEPGGGSADFHLCMPYAMLEPGREVEHDDARTDRGEVDSGWSARLTSNLCGAQVELTANLATAELTVRQLLTLHAGDVIALDLEPAITADVDGVPVVRCSYGVVGGKYALKVQGPLGET